MLHISQLSMINNFNLFEQNFYRRILSCIHDPSTWYNFALSCKYFSKLCQEETPIKKLEFRVSITQWMKGYTMQYIHIHAPSRFNEPMILPNGYLHGNIKTGIDGVDRDDNGSILECDTGNIKLITDIINNRVLVFPIKYPDIYRIFFIRNVLFVNINDINVINNSVRIYNIKKNNFIVGSACCICRKIHTFHISGSDLVYHRRCLETKYIIIVDHYGNPYMETYERRKRITKAILSYAKRIIKGS